MRPNPLHQAYCPVDTCGHTHHQHPSIQTMARKSCVENKAMPPSVSISSNLQAQKATQSIHSNPRHLIESSGRDRKHHGTDSGRHMTHERHACTTPPVPTRQLACHKRIADATRERAAIAVTTATTIRTPSSSGKRGPDKLGTIATRSNGDLAITWC
jgi:hypothetical protein